MRISTSPYLPVDHLVKGHTQAEHIRADGVRLSAEHLGGNVSYGAASTGPNVVGLVGRVLPHILSHATKAGSENPLDEVHPWVLFCGAALCADQAEIDNLGVSVASDKDVLGLEVPVDDPAGMQVLEAKNLCVE